ncbi:hypothetical protein [Mesorhizobium sp.]|uniref:hypothetical protein n=1 Tax=Mesorhizobium sp. TaxID=1871066 RepID=UPI000FE4AF14|nr:hypothetical protein [Mesorhizobium sp.]RWO57167.1 MAG: hypothetical protein EOS14_25225 [Mesorhizobium sp.]
MTGDPPPSDLIAELWAGLDGVTPGPWDVMTCNTVRAIDGDMAIPIFDARMPWKKHRHTTTAVKQEWHNARHVARCSPDNIRILLDRIATLEESALKAEAERDRMSGIICDLFQEDKHYDGCLFKENRNFPCQCGYNDRMAKYQTAVRAAKEHAAAAHLAIRKPGK